MNGEILLLELTNDFSSFDDTDECSTKHLQNVYDLHEIFILIKDSKLDVPYRFPKYRGHFL